MGPRAKLALKAGLALFALGMTTKLTVILTFKTLSQHSYSLSLAGGAGEIACITGILITSAGFAAWIVQTFQKEKGKPKAKKEQETAPAQQR